MKLNRLVAFLQSYTRVVFWCIPFSWKASPLYTMIRMMGTIILPLLTIVASFLGKEIIDLLAHTLDARGSIYSLLIPFFALLLVTLLRKATQSLMQYSQVVHNELISNKISLMVMSKSLDMDLEYFDNPEFRDKLASANQDSQAIASILWSVISAISAMITFISTFVIICQYNILFAFVLIVSAIPASVVTTVFTRTVYNLSIEQVNDKRKMHYTQGIVTDKSYAQEIRLYNIGNWLKQRYLSIWTTLFKQRKSLNKKMIVITSLLECLPEITIILISINVCVDILDGRSTIGDYSLYTGLLAQLWSAVFIVASTATEIYGNKLKIDNIQSLEKFTNHVLDDGHLRLDKVNSISFNHVTFSYPGSNQRALLDVTFQIQKNEKIALVGLNGSGKSTLIKLLLRMYEPDSGEILINGVDIRKYRILDLRSAFSVYFQNMRNFGFTLRENIALADLGQEPSDLLIDTALSNAHFKEILNSSPKRYDVSITRYFDPEGIELSEGQFQKLALSRVFFRRNTVLILDEPSSSLDPLSEKELFDSIKELSNDKITIFTSHRLSNVVLANRIIVLENGKMVEDGTHESLLKNNKRYSELFRYKNEKYKLPQ